MATVDSPQAALVPKSGAITRSKARLAQLTAGPDGVFTYTKIKKERYRVHPKHCKLAGRPPLPYNKAYWRVVPGWKPVVCPDPLLRLSLTQQQAPDLAEALRCDPSHGSLSYELGSVIFGNNCVWVLYVPEGCSASVIHVSALSQSRSIIILQISIRCNANCSSLEHAVSANFPEPLVSNFISTEPLRSNNNNNLHNSAIIKLQPPTHFQAHIGKTPIRIIIDHCSDASYISFTLATSLNLPMHSLALNLTSSIKGDINSVGYTATSICIGDFRTSQTFIIFQGNMAGCQCVLGVDFLKNQLN